MQPSPDLNSLARESAVPLVLVVDDDFCSNKTLQALLVQEGFRAITAIDSRSCFHAINQQTPDLILLDVDFPDESGFDICLKIHDNPLTANIPILFISANDDIASKVQGFEVGGVDYITKPWRRQEILARVRTHLRLQQALRNMAELQSLRINRLREAHDAFLVKAIDSPEAQFSVLFKPLQEAGGDFYDVIPVGDQVYDYVIADISGHDIGMALITSALKMLLRQNCSILNSPQDALININCAITSVLQFGQFVAMTIVRINRKAGKAWVVNAGAPAPVYFSSTRNILSPLGVKGDLIGVFCDASFQTQELKVSPGDRFFLFSDGIMDLCFPDTCGWKEKMHLVTDLFCSVNDSQISAIPDILSGKIARMGQPCDDMVVLSLEV